MNAKPLFTSQSAKLAAGIGRGVRGVILYLVPAVFEGRNNCPQASAGCAASCLVSAGRMDMSNSRKAREWRTRMLRHDSAAFFAQLRAEIRKVERRAAKSGDVAAVRLDGTSDLGLAGRFASEFPGVTFYDYTKNPQRMRLWLAARARGEQANRWLTFSRSETNEADCLDILARGGNVAVPFTTRKGDVLPATWKGFRVIDGDSHDWRFLDAAEGGSVVVGLRAKGKAKKDRTSGFVVKVEGV